MGDSLSHVDTAQYIILIQNEINEINYSTLHRYRYRSIDQYFSKLILPQNENFIKSIIFIIIFLF